MLGELGFAIYLLQVPVFQALVIAGMAPTSARGFAAYLMVLIAASFVAYFAFERPLQRALRHGVLARIAARPDRARDAAWLAVPISMGAFLAAMQLGVMAPFGGPTLGAEPVKGVEESGFHYTEWQDGRPFRWTNGTAWVRIPIDRAPSSVRVTIGPAPRPDTTIRIFFNRSLRFEGPLTGNGFSQTLPLQGMRLRKHLRVTIESSKFRPREVDPSIGDGRVLGVPLHGIELLY